MRRGFFKKYTDSLIRPAFAAEVTGGARRTGAASYFFLILLFSVIITSVAMSVSFTTMGTVDDFKYTLDSNVPYFSLSDDGLEIDIPDAVVLLHPSDTDTYFVISPYELEMYPDYDGFTDFNGSKIYIGPDTAYFRTAQYGYTNEYRFAYSDMDIRGVFDKDDLINAVDPIAAVIVACVFVFGLIGAFAGGAIFMLIVALIAMLINSAMGTGLRFGQLYGLSVYAMTAHVTIKTIIGVTNWIGGTDLDIHWLISYGITLVFVILYLRAVKNAMRDPYTGGEAETINAIDMVNTANTPYTDSTPGSNGDNGNNTLPPFDPNK